MNAPSAWSAKRPVFWLTQAPGERTVHVVEGPGIPDPGRLTICGRRVGLGWIHSAYAALPPGIRCEECG